MKSGDDLPSAPREWREYERRKQTYDAAMDVWRRAGKLGAPPPRPVRPHTPGWIPRTDPDLET